MREVIHHIKYDVSIGCLLFRRFVESLHHVRDKYFQSLSVSAELRLPLMEGSYTISDLRPAQAVSCH